MLFARADETSAKILAECLESFGDQSGLRANGLKSHVYMAGIDDRTKERLLEVIGFQEGSFPFRYLGIPLAAERLKVSNYGPFLDALRRKISVWPKHSLSYAGKMELMRSVLQGVACYWLTMLPIPGAVIDKIKTIARNFLWSSKHPPISWDTLCLPKEDGGYGLRDLRAWNVALLSKTLWDIHCNTSSLWVRWIQQHYVKGANFWEWEAGKEGSTLIKKLVEIREDIKRKCGGIGEANMKLIEMFASAKGGVHEAYKFFQPRADKVTWEPIVWRAEIMPKHRFIMWLLAHGKLRTADRMEYEMNKMCCLCQGPDETNNHLFFRCRITRALWSKIKQWLGYKFNFSTMDGLLMHMKRRFKGKTDKEKVAYLALSSMIYTIWGARNRKKFEGLEPDINQMFRKLQIHVHRFAQVRAS